jgi:hypothetical protein
MDATIAQYFLDHSITTQKISNASGVDMATLSNALNKPVESWPVRIVNTVSEASGEKSSDALHQLQPQKLDLVLDDDNLTIQGVQFDDQYSYQIVRNAALSNVYEGWEPSYRDILRGKNKLTAPDSELVAHYNAVFGERG